MIIDLPPGMRPDQAVFSESESSNQPESPTAVVTGNCSLISN